MTNKTGDFKMYRKIPRLTEPTEVYKLIVLCQTSGII